MTTPLALKVCGMRAEDNIRALLALPRPPDYFGLIFVPSSPRYVGDSLLPERRSPDWSSRAVGVFVDVALDDALACVHRYKLGGAQLHGSETPEYCRELRRKFELELEIESDFRRENAADAPRAPLTIFKAFSIGDERDVESVAAYDGAIDYALLDAKGAARGGNGVRFDWSALEAYRASVPVFISGGVALEHAEELRALPYPFVRGVDINSRFELAPGVKDIDRVRDFTQRLFGVE